MLSDNVIAKAAEEYSVDPFLIKAVISVETPYPHQGDVKKGIPLILNERHKFYKFSGDIPVSKTHPHLSNRKPGGYCTGQDWIARQQCEHERLNQKREIYNGVLEEAAYLSISMGLFQVMGFNHKLLGYDDVFDMWADAIKVDDEIDLRWFFSFCKNAGILKYLQNDDVTRFVAGYNGKYHYRNKYVPKIVKWRRIWRESGLQLTEIAAPIDFPVTGKDYYKCTANV